MPLNLLKKEDRLISECFPKSKLLPGLAPDYQPPSQELSRLTYHASNKPSKLHHLASELCSKAEHDSKRASSSPRYKSSFMLTLYILKALCEECRRDLPLFSFSVLKTISYALDVRLPVSAGPASSGVDLEILARASSVFRAFTTYTLLPPDTPALAAIYHSILRRFAALAVLKDSNADDETVLRIRLLALAAISSSVTSDVLGGREYRHMIEVVVACLLGCCENVEISELLAQSGMEPSSSSKAITTNSAPELRLRRAQSVHHVPGSPGPTQEEISQAAIVSFKSLVQRASGGQLEEVVEVLGGWLDRGDRWSRTEWVEGLVVGMAGWGGVQYRFVLPTTIAEVLLSLPDSPKQEVKRATLLSALKKLLDSSLSLIGLSPSTLLSSLLTLLLRQPTPDVLAAIGALASKIYYKDQNIDFVEEILARLEGANTPDRLVPLLDASRVILTAGRKGGPSGLKTLVAGDRSHIPPETIIPSVQLLGHSSTVVRSAYSSLLIVYIQQELPSSAESDIRFYSRVLSTLHDLLQTSPAPSTSSSPHPSASTQSSPRHRRVSLLVNTAQPEPSDYSDASALLQTVVEKGGAKVVPDVVGLLAAIESTPTAGKFVDVWSILGQGYVGRSLDGDSKVGQLAGSESLQAELGLDRAALEDRLTSPYAPTTDADRSPVASSARLRPVSGLMAGENTSMLSFTWAGGVGGGKQREGLGVGDLREALTGRSSMSTTHLGDKTASLSSTANYSSSVHNASVKGLGARTAGRKTKTKPDDVAELFRRLGIGKEGKKSKIGSVNGSSKGRSEGTVVLKAEDLSLGPVIQAGSQS